MGSRLPNEADANRDQNQSGHNFQEGYKFCKVDRKMENAKECHQAIDDIQNSSCHAAQEAAQKAMLDCLGDDKNIHRPEGDGRYKTDQQAKQDDHFSNSLLLTFYSVKGLSFIANRVKAVNFTL